MTPARSTRFTLLLMLLGPVVPTAWGIEMGRIDTFPCSSAECDAPADNFEFNVLGQINGWKQGPSKISTDFPGGMERVVHGGPGGDGDHFLQLTSFARTDEFNDAHTKLVVLNRGAWTGDYLSAGVDEINVDLINLGGIGNPTNPPPVNDPDYDHDTGNDLRIRLLFEGGETRRIFTRESIALPVGSGWQNVSFSIQPGDLIGPDADGLSGLDLANAVLQNTGVFRIFHSDIADEDVDAFLGSVFPPTQGGFSGILGIDNVYARLPGDFDQDVDEDADDIDALSLAIQSSSADSRFDLNDDETVDAEDGAVFLAERVGTLPGDFNLDGQVDVQDLSVWAIGFGNADVFSQGDSDFNGQVDVADLSQWATDFGNTAPAPLTTTSSATAIPEPGCLAFLSATTAMMVRRPTGGQRG